MAMKQLGRALRRWFNHDGPGQAAAVSFYAIFAMAPLLVFGVVVSSKTLGPEKARIAAINWLSDMVPGEAAESLVSVVQMKLFAEGAWWSNLLSGFILIWAVSLVFVRLINGTRNLFDRKPETLGGLLRRNLFGRLFALLFAILAGALICGLFIGSSLAAPLIREWNIGTKGALSGLNAVVLSLGSVGLFAISSRKRPNPRALAASGIFLLLAFLAGRALFQYYITRSPVASAYGVASSLVVFLLWIYYLSCGFFIGAAICAEVNEEARKTGRRAG